MLAGSESSDEPFSGEEVSENEEQKHEEPNEEWKDKRSRPQQIIEKVLLNLTMVAWQADNALLPAVFHELSQEFHVTTTSLSILVLLRGVSESLFAFPSGFLADMLPRPKLICVGSIIWAIGLVGCAAAPSFNFVCIARLVNGMGLGIVLPLLTSLVADTNAPSRRGMAFGTMQFTGNVGATLGSLLATTLAPLVIMSVAGWRFVLYLVALFSAAIGIAVMLLVGEPRAHIQDAGKSFTSVFVTNMPKVCKLFRIRTFVIVLLQGAPGTIPWFAFSFLTMWLELSCFDNFTAANIFMWFGFGTAASGLIGGFVLDRVAKRFPNHGPPALAQMSAGIGIPLLGLIFFGLPSAEGASSAAVLLYKSVFFVFGLMVAACGVINAKVFSDIVPQGIFSYVYAVDRAIEGTIGASGSPMVGLLTDKVFHYNSTKAQAGDCSPEDAKSLGSGVFSISLFAWSICFLCYSLMHCSYPEDRRRMLQEVVPGKGAPPVLSCSAPDSNSDESDSDAGIQLTGRAAAA